MTIPKQSQNKNYHDFCLTKLLIEINTYQHTTLSPEKKKQQQHITHF